MSRIYINVPYAEKEHAKKLKARWDPSEKSWFTLENNIYKDLLFNTYGTREEPVYIPEGCILWGGRIRKERFFDLNGDEI